MDQPTTSAAFVAPPGPGEVEREKLHYFTFGPAHTDPHRPGSAHLGNSYVAIYGTEEATRRLMVSHFGNGWAFQYDTRDEVDRFNLQRYVPDWTQR